MFHPNISSSFNFNLESQFKLISFIFLVFRSLNYWKNLLCSIFDFSEKSKSTSVIFDSVDSSSSPLS